MRILALVLCLQLGLGCASRSGGHAMLAVGGVSLGVAGLTAIGTTVGTSHDPGTNDQSSAKTFATVLGITGLVLVLAGLGSLANSPPSDPPSAPQQ